MNLGRERFCKSKLSFPGTQRNFSGQGSNPDHSIPNPARKAIGHQASHSAEYFRTNKPLFFLPIRHRTLLRTIWRCSYSLVTWFCSPPPFPWPPCALYLTTLLRSGVMHSNCAPTSDGHLERGWKTLAPGRYLWQTDWTCYQCPVLETLTVHCMLSTLQTHTRGTNQSGLSCFFQTNHNQIRNLHFYNYFAADRLQLLGFS